MFKSIINLFFPPVCAGCNSFLLVNEKVICTVCRHDIPLTNHHLNPENDAFKKFYGRIPVLHASALFYFHKKGIVQQLIHNLKYKGQEEIGTTIAQWYAEALKTIELSIFLLLLCTECIGKQKVCSQSFHENIIHRFFRPV